MGSRPMQKVHAKPRCSEKIDSTFLSTGRRATPHLLVQCSIDKSGASRVTKNKSRIFLNILADFSDQSAQYAVNGKALRKVDFVPISANA